MEDEFSRKRMTRRSFDALQGYSHQTQVLPISGFTTQSTRAEMTRKKLKKMEVGCK